MSEEELYKLAITDVPKYSLLNEILAIRDNRFPDEETDYTIKVYGSISLDVLNKYVELVQENEKLKGVIETYEILIKANNINNWNELKKWLEEEIKHLEKSRYVSFNEYGENKLRIFKDFQFKMQELENREVKG